MSAYITLMTPMTDEECLLEALAELGFDRSKVEVHATPVQLVGFAGDRRQRTANLVIRRQHVGSMSNDIGFLATATGYHAIVSDYDRAHHGQGWLAQLGARYQEHWNAKRERLAAEERRRLEAERQRVVEAQRAAIHERARKLFYRVEETRDGETIRLALVKRTY
ncbi:DUF1257 domain-containing protein [Paraliomyxa miuraensis]|uniref:DUF1257 domain-containing protein n=1 Tax=Paraliomyxa miuraensis TaxID=376150 RepID=UPI0022508049|nr:DUF1257 domain-containing protein [Paraliomyxa miuraensis]MCX4242518.1 DUF1257 domain-containing protein [Paraliomyxa miuraensis]